MSREMSWKECIEKGIITKTVPDKDRSIQMIKMSNLRIEFWDKPIDDKFVALKIESYYDIIKELVFAHIYQNGYNCTNHLCIISYLKENLIDFEFEVQKIDELRKVRNEISYRGTNVRKDYLERNELEFKNIIKKT